MEIRDIILTLSLFVALAAFSVSAFNYVRSRKESRTQLYLQLRTRYLDVRKEIPSAHFASADSSDPINRQNSAWVEIEQYWYNAFDEWFATKKLGNKEHCYLWENYYRSAIQSTLESFDMRVVLVEMLNGTLSFGELRGEFRSEMNAMWKELDASHSDILASV